MKVATMARLVSAPSRRVGPFIGVSTLALIGACSLHSLDYLDASAGGNDLPAGGASGGGTGAGVAGTLGGTGASAGGTGAAGHPEGAWGKRAELGPMLEARAKEEPQLHSPTLPTVTTGRRPATRPTRIAAGAAANPVWRASAA